MLNVPPNFRLLDVISCNLIFYVSKPSRSGLNQLLVCSPQQESDTRKRSFLTASFAFQ